MPHKITNASNSTLASGDSSSSDQVIAAEVRGMHQLILAHLSPIVLHLDPARLMQIVPWSVTNPVRKPPVIVHNKGGQIYDETRPSDWDKQRWK